VVIGRGCLGRPWLFADLVDAFAGRPVRPAPALGAVLDVMVEHAEALERHCAPGRGIREFRKHAGWYLTGYPVGGEARRRFAEVDALDALRALAAVQDRGMRLVPGGERFARGHTNGPIRVALPEGYLAHLEDLTVPDEPVLAHLSGG
jgi:hypothetical protein